MSAREATRGAVVAALVGTALDCATVEVGGVAVELWSASVDAVVDAAGARARPCSALERARADAQRGAEERARYLATRLALRAVLHAHLGEPPERIEIESGAHGKPALAGGARPVGFNLSHSRDLLAIAVAPRAEVGVDVEGPRELRDVERLVRRMLTDAERALLARWEEEGLARADAFRRVWTVKEARIKALGLPVGAALSRSHPEVERLPWREIPLAGWPGYFGALAVAAPE